MKLSFDESSYNLGAEPFIVFIAAERLGFLCPSNFDAATRLNVPCDGNRPPTDGRRPMRQRVGCQFMESEREAARRPAL